MGVVGNLLLSRSAGKVDNVVEPLEEDTADGRELALLLFDSPVFLRRNRNILVPPQMQLMLTYAATVAM